MEKIKNFSLMMLLAISSNAIASGLVLNPSQPIQNSQSVGLPKGTGVQDSTSLTQVTITNEVNYTCNPSTFTWNSGCNGDSDRLQFGSSETIQNQANGFTGSTTITCNVDGQLTSSNPSCVANTGCPEGRISWNSANFSCNGPYPASANGTALLVFNNVNYTTIYGIITLNCVNGNWISSNSKCEAAIVGQE